MREMDHEWVGMALHGLEGFPIIRAFSCVRNLNQRDRERGCMTVANLIEEAKGR